MFLAFYKDLMQRHHRIVHGEDATVDRDVAIVTPKKPGAKATALYHTPSPKKVDRNTGWSPVSISSTGRRATEIPRSTRVESFATGRTRSSSRAFAVAVGEHAYDATTFKIIADS
jgi:hypothetical protein